MKFVAFLFAMLGFVTGHVILDSRERDTITVAGAIIGNIVMLFVFIACLLARRKSSNLVHRHNLLVYFVVLPIVFYACGFGYAAFSSSR